MKSCKYLLPFPSIRAIVVMRVRPALPAAVGIMAVALLVGCASVEAGIKTMSDKLDGANSRNMVKSLRSFPDQALRAVYVGPDGRAATNNFSCEACGIYTKQQAGPTESFPLDFIMISRAGPRVHDTQALAVLNATNPIESQDAGRAFIALARSRGHYISVYGPVVNDRILQALNAPQPRSQGYWYPTNVSSCLVERDETGTFISILAVGFELSNGVIVSQSAEAKDVFTAQRLFILPFGTARYLQERLGNGQIENNRIR
ncbi:MAG: hypothetical protein OJJ21_19245 [Ferrovibrio sp.]|uniref:hypothetical protein n=1 Tax=Ferrovibrio sp. TaxID=1917215 RepID=UPI00261F9E94|nr:hypothetical protein [Ferrovibrio sp.]MCW0235745.1 hypothetical protein [Ferrovibrio sp.]